MISGTQETCPKLHPLVLVLVRISLFARGINSCKLRRPLLETNAYTSTMLTTSFHVWGKPWAIQCHLECRTTSSSNVSAYWISVSINAIYLIIMMCYLGNVPLYTWFQFLQHDSFSFTSKSIFKMLLHWRSAPRHYEHYIIYI